ncbi:hypothetical protein QQZ08_002778 [Neonectria magnoliae]|uniref:F-box domain-containing protein n=1 Tax=Neonectria magnoliae TaxID=2732573 RepID=A0ABR1IAV8_9HYPO
MQPSYPRGSQDGDISDHETGTGQAHGSGLEDEEHSQSRKRLLGTGNSSSCLENLPAELRSRILSSIPDLPTLRSLVHASPVLHAQYRYGRNGILRACLNRELSGFLIDAYANLKSRVRELGSPRTDQKIIEFLNSYRAWLSDSGPHPDLNSIDAGFIRWMAAYHLSVARPLAGRYCKWAHANLRRAVSSSRAQKQPVEGSDVPEDVDICLERSEEIRVFRSLYRYDTYHHLFGRNQGKRHGGFRHHEINQHFFCLFNPWEVEAVGCIDLFVRQKYEEIFDAVKDDLNPQNSRFRLENGIYNPDGSFDLIGEHDGKQNCPPVHQASIRLLIETATDYMDGTVSRGLKMTARLLAIDNREKLVAKMQRCLTHDESLDDPMRKVLGTVAQSDRRDMSPNSNDEAEQRRDPIDFVGDGMRPDGPPLAWVLLWGGKYANIYGEYVPESLRRWGYVMWNERQWNDSGAKELIATQWQTAPELVDEIENDYDWRPVSNLVLG